MHQKNPILLALIIFVSLFFFLTSLQADENKEEFNKVVPLSAQGTFSLDNVNGSVTVTTWTEGKVEIKAVKSTSKNAENLAKVKIEVESTAASVSVKTVYPQHDNTGVSVTYDVKVPEGVSLGKVSSVNGKISLSGPFGKVSAETTNGNIFVDRASGESSFSTTNGDIKALNVKGMIKSNTVNGSIELSVGAVENEIKAETVNGSISLQLGAAKEINADLKAETVNGSISFDVPVTLQELSKTKHTLDGKLGKGGPLISLKTVNGSIHLAK